MRGMAAEGGRRGTSERCIVAGSSDISRIAGSGPRAFLFCGVGRKEAGQLAGSGSSRGGATRNGIAIAAPSAVFRVAE